jgi:hypothetical protein
MRKTLFAAAVLASATITASPLPASALDSTTATQIVGTRTATQPATGAAHCSGDTHKGDGVKLQLLVTSNCVLTSMYAETTAPRRGHFSFWRHEGAHPIGDSPDGNYGPGLGFTQQVGQETFPGELWCARLWELRDGNWVGTGPNCVRVR